MAIIQVPKPPKSAWDPDRPLSTLVKSQVEHLYEAERKLPHKYKSQIYINAIQTEGEAARYIQKVTEAIQKAHQDAAAGRVKAAPKRRSTIAIAAVADEPRSAKGATKTKTAKSKATKKAQSTKRKSAAKTKSGAKAGRKK